MIFGRLLAGIRIQGEVRTRLRLPDGSEFRDQDGSEDDCGADDGAQGQLLMEEEGGHQGAENGFGRHQDGGPGLGRPLLGYSLEQERDAGGEQSEVNSRQDRQGGGHGGGVFNLAEAKERLDADSSQGQNGSRTELEDRQGNGVAATADKIAREIDVKGKSHRAQEGEQIADIDRTVQIETDQADADNREQRTDHAGTLDLV